MRCLKRGNPYLTHWDGPSEYEESVYEWAEMLNKNPEINIPLRDSAGRWQYAPAEEVRLIRAEIDKVFAAQGITRSTGAPGTAEPWRGKPWEQSYPTRGDTFQLGGERYSETGAGFTMNERKMMGHLTSKVLPEIGRLEEFIALTNREGGKVGRKTHERLATLLKEASDVRKQIKNADSRIKLREEIPLAPKNWGSFNKAFKGMSAERRAIYLRQVAGRRGIPIDLSESGTDLYSKVRDSYNRPANKAPEYVAGGRALESEMLVQEAKVTAQELTSLNRGLQLSPPAAQGGASPPMGGSGSPPSSPGAGGGALPPPGGPPPPGGGPLGMPGKRPFEGFGERVMKGAPGAMAVFRRLNLLSPALDLHPEIAAPLITAEARGRLISGPIQTAYRDTLGKLKSKDKSWLKQHFAELIEGDDNPMAKVPADMPEARSVLSGFWKEAADAVHGAANESSLHVPESGTVLPS